MVNKLSGIAGCRKVSWAKDPAGQHPKEGFDTPPQAPEVISGCESKPKATHHHTPE